jgi:hypothetical protein
MADMIDIGDPFGRVGGFSSGDAVLICSMGRARFADWMVSLMPPGSDSRNMLMSNSTSCVE